MPRRDPCRSLRSGGITRRSECLTRSSSGGARRATTGPRGGVCLRVSKEAGLRVIGEVTSHRFQSFEFRLRGFRRCKLFSGDRFLIGGVRASRSGHKYKVVFKLKCR